MRFDKTITLVGLVLGLVATAEVASAATFYVDGACSSSGNGTTLTCGSSGPFKTIQEGINKLATLDGTTPLTLYIRGAHDAFDGVYREYVQIWGPRALTCTASNPCVVEGCPASVCGNNERPLVSGFLTTNTGWAQSGSGSNTVYSRAPAARGNTTEYGYEQPWDAGYGSNSGRWNPMYLLESNNKSLMRFGGSCQGNFANPCGGSFQCGGNTCDMTKPPDGYWGLSCTGCPSCNCTMYVNPTGTNDPTAGYKVWIPDRNAVWVADGTNDCPSNNSDGCPAIQYFTARRIDIEGGRWLNVLHSDATETPAKSVTYDDVTARYSSRYLFNFARCIGCSFKNLTAEYVGRGLSLDTGGSFGVRQFLMWGNSTFDNIIVRHAGSAGAADGDANGTPDKWRSCDMCEAPWNNSCTTTACTAGQIVWGTPAIGVDIKQSNNITVRDVTASDVLGQGFRFDACYNATLDGANISDTKSGVMIDQFTPETYVSPPHNRSYNITIKNVRAWANGHNDTGAINVGNYYNGGGCITPLQAGEYIRIDNNQLWKNSFAGLWLCYDTTMCSGGANHLGSCGKGCPGGSCVTASGNGTIEVYNNTIWQDRLNPRPTGGTYQYTDAAGITVRNGNSNTTDPTINNLKIKNNIFKDVTWEAISLSSGTAAAPGLEIDANLYNNGDNDRDCAVRWGTTCYSTLAAFKTAKSGYETRGIESDPRLVSATSGDFRLCIAAGAPAASCTAASPAINVGVQVGIPFVGAAPDLGALEVGGAAPGPPPPTLLEVVPIN